MFLLIELPDLIVIKERIKQSIDPDSPLDSQVISDHMSRFLLETFLVLSGHIDPSERILEVIESPEFLSLIDNIRRVITTIDDSQMIANVKLLNHRAEILVSLYSNES